MLRTTVIARIKRELFFGIKQGDLIAIAIQPADNLNLTAAFVEQEKECVICTAKLKPDSTAMGLGGMSWREFFNFFDIVAFTEYCEKGRFPKGWGENEGTIYWR